MILDKFALFMTARNCEQMPISQWMGSENVAYLCNGILLSYLEKQTIKFTGKSIEQENNSDPKR